MVMARDDSLFLRQTHMKHQNEIQNEKGAPKLTHKAQIHDRINWETPMLLPYKGGNMGKHNIWWYMFFMDLGLSYFQVKQGWSSTSISINAWNVCAPWGSATARHVHCFRLWQPDMLTLGVLSLIASASLAQQHFDLNQWFFSDQMNFTKDVSLGTHSYWL